MKLIGTLKLWQKFAGVIAIVGLFFILIVWIGHKTLKDTERSYLDVIYIDGEMFRLANRLDQLLFQMRQVENTFQASPSNELAQSHKSLFVAFNNSLAVLRKMDVEAGHNADIVTDDEIALQVKNYRTAFLDMVDAWSVKGFDEYSGLQGKFARQALDFERTFNEFDVDELYTSLLRINDSVQAYQITGKKKYKGRIQREAKEFTRLLKESRLGKTMREELTKRLSALIQSFDNFSTHPDVDQQFKALETAVRQVAIPLRSNQVRHIWRDYYRVRRLEKDYLKSGNERYASGLAGIIVNMQGNIDKSSVPDDVVIVVKLQEYLDDFKILVDQDQLISSRSNDMQVAVQAIESLVGSYLDRVKNEMELAVTKTSELAQWRSNSALALAAALMLITLLVTFVLVRRLVHSITQVSIAMNDMAGGDISSEIPVVSRDEIGQMAGAFNRMAVRLADAHKGLEGEKEKLTTILLSAQEGIVVTDRNGQVALVNPSAQTLLGKSREQITSEGFVNLLDDPTTLVRILSSDSGVPELLEIGEHKLSFFASTIEDEQGQPIGTAALIRDVTEEKNLEQRLIELSNTDGLTGLLNRRCMDELLIAEFERSQRYSLTFSLLMFDVDHFKRFNDDHGHDQGDRVLKALAQSMKEHFRRVDHCCRYGGEEFCIIMPNTDKAGMMLAAERYREKVEKMAVDGLQVTISIGAACYPYAVDENNTPDHLVKTADAALYDAKESGRNRVCEAKAAEGPSTATV